MSRFSIELITGPLRQMRRSSIGWGIGLSALVVVTVAFWPAFKGSSGISAAIDQLPSGIVDAFGLAGFGTPAGFLRGNLYDFVVPLLLVIAAVAVANGLTSSEEDSGRMEIYLSQPVSRRSLFTGRAMALSIWLVAMTVLIMVVQFVSDIAVGLDIDPARVVATVTLCGLLAFLYGSLALAIAGFYPRPSAVLSVAVAAAVAGYLISALLPLSDVLEPLSAISPWKWAFGGDPLVNATEPWRYVLLAVPAVALAVVGIAAFMRRDIRAA